MSRNKLVKIIVDVLMYADLVFLMNYGTDHRLFLHGCLGFALFALVLLHNLLNLWFFKTAGKGKYSAKRIVLNVTDWLLIALIIVMGVSSIMMTGLVFEWSPIRTTQAGRILHLSSCSWGFIVMSFHLGLHTETPLKKLDRKVESRGSRLLKAVVNSIYAVIALLGIFAFYKSQIYVYLFNTGGWKMSAMYLVTGILEYAGITAGMCMMIHLFYKVKSSRVRPYN